MITFPFWFLTILLSLMLVGAWRYWGRYQFATPAPLPPLQPTPQIWNEVAAVVETFAPPPAGVVGSDQIRHAAMRLKSVQDENAAELAAIEASARARREEYLAAVTDAQQLVAACAVPTKTTTEPS